MRFAAHPFETYYTPTPPPIDWDPDEYMPHQAYGWSCSACALAWVLRATGLNPGATEQSAINEIGVGAVCGGDVNITPSLGLCDASGPALRAVYASYGQETEQAWLDFDTVYDLAQGTTGQMSGASWYHWVAIRGVEGTNILIANSAPGYMGVYSVLSRSDFDRLGGFSVVWLT